MKEEDFHPLLILLVLFVAICYGMGAYTIGFAIGEFIQSFF
jgi:hypothetical protein